jgi:hypothetical protein
VSTKRLNEQVRRNRARFPADFMFRLTRAEWNLVLTDIASTSQHIGQQQDTFNRSQIATGSQKHRSRNAPPYAFTEHGALMVANVLKSPRARLSWPLAGLSRRSQSSLRYRVPAIIPR